MKTRKEVMKEFLEAKAKDAVVAETTVKSDENLKARFFKAFASKDTSALKALQPEIVEEYKSLADGQNVTNAGDGGYLVPVEIYQQIQKKLDYISPIRQYATVVNVGAKTKFNIANGKPQVYWVAEGGAITRKKATFAQKEIDLHKVAGLGGLSWESMNDTVSTPALQDYLVETFAEAIAEAENEAFVNGNGSGKPFGFTNADITPAYTGTTTALTAEDLVKLKYGLNPAYRNNAIFMANSATMAKIVGMTDTTGRPIYVSGLAEGEADRVLGRPAVEVPELADDVIYFAYMKDYIIGVNGSLRIDYGTTGDDFETDKVSVRVIDRVGGRATMGNGFGKLTITSGK